MIVTSQYVFSNPKLSEINYFIEKLRLERDQNMVTKIVEKVRTKIMLNFWMKY